MTDKRLIIALSIDIIDFAIGWIPGVGEIIDLIQLVVALVMYGPYGLIAIGELVNLIDPIDSILPTMTIIHFLATAGRR